MPRHVTKNDEGKQVERYRWPAEQVSPTAEIGTTMREWRKQAICDQEYFSALHKGESDRELARFFKDSAREALRTQRAITLALPWPAEPDEKQEPLAPNLWPLDLEAEMDRVWRKIVLQFG